MKEGVGAGSLFALGLNGIVGVGIFFTPQLLVRQVPGAAGIWVFPVTACVLLPIALAFARLGSRLALDGGPYVWAEAAFGSKAAAWVGWIAFVSALLSTAAVFAGLRDYAAADLGLTTGLGRIVFTWLCAAAFAGVGALGLRPSAWAWNFLTLAKLTPLLALLVLWGYALIARAPRDQLLTHSTGVTPDWGRAMLICVFPLQGFEVVPVLSGSARSPRHVPLATLGALLVAAGLYAIIHAVCLAELPELARIPAPLVAAARTLGGAGMGHAVSIGTHISAFGIAFGMTVMTPRYLAALGGPAALGAGLSRVDARQVPQRALWLCVLAVTLLVSVQGLSSLFVLSSSAVLFQYVSALAALLTLSWRRRHGFERSSLWLPVTGVGAVLLLMRAVQWRELIVLLGALALGALLLLGRAKSRLA